jgi:sialic acid synthase SpsE
MTEIIAELCQNHNGDKNLLENMVRIAAKSGATHIKIQNIFASHLTFRPQFELGLSNNGIDHAIKRPYDVEYERLKKLELDYETVKYFISLCNDLGTIPMTTCFARADVKTIYDLGFRCIKVASYDCSSFQLLRDISLYDWKIYLSTGATYDEEIKKAANILKYNNFIFLHCVSLYPTPIEVVNFSRINWLRNFTNKVGYSDHSLADNNGNFACMLAMALGADVIERHFTILDSKLTKDGAVSITPLMLEELVNFSKIPIDERLDKLKIDKKYLENLLGTPQRALTDKELLNRDYYRGRFASPRPQTINGKQMIFNWEEVDI